MSCVEDLAAAKLALHKLVMGESVVRIQFEGEATDFVPSQIPALRRHIRQLTSECGGTDGAPSRRAPMRPFY